MGLNVTNRRGTTARLQVENLRRVKRCATVMPERVEDFSEDLVMASSKPPKPAVATIIFFKRGIELGFAEIGP